MKNSLQKFYDYIQQPLFMPARLLLVVFVIPLVLTFTQPLWRISMEAPQYPKGLWMDIYAYKLEGGDDGQHIDEINGLNHYIGMQTINRSSLNDLDWIPFALGALALLTLRVAAIGNIRMLLDLAVMTSYVTLFALGRFAYRLYVFGHNLDPRAPVTVEPFMPALIGTKQVANFTTHSMPRPGTYYMAAFAIGLMAVTAWHLIAGRRRALRAEREAQARRVPATAS